MPRPNPPRAIHGESALARRIAYERQLRGMSLDGLAKRMADAGCPINASAIYKIESGDPPRRITVDELIALAAVFDLPIADLLVAPELAFDERAKALVKAYGQATSALVHAQHALVEAERAMFEHMLLSDETWVLQGESPPPAEMKQRLRELIREHSPNRDLHERLTADEAALDAKLAKAKRAKKRG